MLLNTCVAPRHLLERLDPARILGGQDVDQHAMFEPAQEGHACGPPGN